MIANVALGLALLANNVGDGGARAACGATVTYLTAGPRGSSATETVVGPRCDRSVTRSAWTPSGTVADAFNTEALLDYRGRPSAEIFRAGAGQSGPTVLSAEYELDAAGRIAREILKVPPLPQTTLFDAHAVTGWFAYDRDASGRLRKLTSFFYAGADGQWFTRDDVEEYTVELTRDEAGRVIAALTTLAPGNTGAPVREVGPPQLIRAQVSYGKDAIVVTTDRGETVRLQGDVCGEPCFERLLLTVLAPGSGPGHVVTFRGRSRYAPGGLR